MGKRSTGRRLAMQAMYEADLGGFPIEEALSHVFDQEHIVDDTKEFAREIAVSAWENLGRTDQLIQKYAKGWSLDRIGGVDRNILRLSIYELSAKATPPEVVINEAIELAKKYSTAEASKFINGILGAYIKDITNR